MIDTDYVISEALFYASTFRTSLIIYSTFRTVNTILSTFRTLFIAHKSEGEKLCFMLTM